MQIIPKSDISKVVYSDADSRCWKSAEIPKIAIRRRQQICAENSLVGEYGLLPVAEESDDLTNCWEPGTYRFFQSYRLNPERMEPDTGVKFEWELAFEVTDQQAIDIISSEARLED